MTQRTFPGCVAGRISTTAIGLAATCAALYALLGGNETLAWLPMLAILAITGGGLIAVIFAMNHMIIEVLGIAMGFIGLAVALVATLPRLGTGGLGVGIPLLLVAIAGFWWTVFGFRLMPQSPHRADVPHLGDGPHPRAH